ncbi:hypothetical protein [uncultured Muribaculum sp.]|uniref:hypothetical protein n=1 Tax=uncultured Muribaculum sp. TaxID=1918613 RepID=UPI002583509F|nr:hypothetical protein [uncultured Muribaculum sp.]
MKTKSLIITLVALIGLCSCGKSREEKAQEMAANYLKGVLYHFDSYEPLQTKVDSSFVALSTDKEAIELTLNMLKLFNSAQEYADKVDRAESSMEIWSPSGYSSAYSKGEYRRAKEERNNNQQLLDKTKERIKNQFSKIKSRQSYLEAEALLKIGDFNGWKVYHKFKSLNGAGTLDLFGEYVFFCDKDFNVESAYSREDFDAINKIMVAISESTELPELGEKLQEVIF